MCTSPRIPSNLTVDRSNYTFLGSRQFLHRGPPSADVKGVEMITEKQNVSESEIKKALGDGGDEYEVRHYRG